MLKIDTFQKNYICRIINNIFNYDCSKGIQHSTKYIHKRYKEDKVIEPRYLFGYTMFDKDDQDKNECCKSTTYINQEILPLTYNCIYDNLDNYKTININKEKTNIDSNFNYNLEHSLSYLNYDFIYNNYIENTKLTVIIIRYNLDITDLIQSIPNNVNIIVIDNHSNDKLENLLNNITYIYFNEDTEVAVLKNFALSLVKTDYILFASQHITYNYNDILHNIDNIYNMCNIYSVDAIFYNSLLDDKKFISLKDIQDNNYFINDTDFLSGLVLKKEVFKKLQFFFEQYYAYNEDIKFLCMMLSRNISILSIKQNIYNIKYPTGYTYPDVYNTSINRIARLYSNNDNISDLTVVLAFYNENVEVEKTVASVRATSNKFIPIILVNDDSDDGCDYKAIADIYDCEYYEMPEKSGPSMSKNYGVSKVKTPYFLLLDAHMRMYNDGWDDYMLDNALKKYNNAIFCSQCFTIHKRWEEDINVYSKELWNKTWFLNHGAFFGLGIKKPSIQAWWGANVIYNKASWKDDKVVPISCVMGASYASSKSWWDYIHGYNGLRGYGDEEFFISMKTWQAGGKVLSIKNIGIGHIAKYYYSSACNPDFNHFIDYYIAKVCGDDMFFNWFVKYNKIVKHHYTKKWLDYINDPEIEKERQYQQSIRKHDIKWVLQEINGRALNDNSNNEYCGKNQDYQIPVPYPFFKDKEYYKNNNIIFNI